MPQGDEIDDDGFGFFQDTWLIKDVPVGDAEEIVRTERDIARIVGDLADTSQAFERLAGPAESAEVHDPSEELSDAERAALSEVVSDGT